MNRKIRFLLILFAHFSQDRNEANGIKSQFYIHFFLTFCKVWSASILLVVCLCVCACIYKRQEEKKIPTARKLFILPFFLSFFFESAIDSQSFFVRHVITFFFSVDSLQVNFTLKETNMSFFRLFACFPWILYFIFRCIENIFFFGACTNAIWFFLYFAIRLFIFLLIFHENCLHTFVNCCLWIDNEIFRLVATKNRRKKVQFKVKHRNKWKLKTKTSEWNAQKLL